MKSRMKETGSNCDILIAYGKPAGHREVAPRECAVHPRGKPEREAEEKRRRRTEP
jgi:hypothetical protein